MEKIIDLKELVTPTKTDSISGRSFGEEFAKKIDLIKNFEEGYTIIIKIDSNFIKAINDSFIKGLFSSLFEKEKTIIKIKEKIKIEAEDYYLNLFEKNWLILQKIYNV